MRNLTACHHSFAAKIRAVAKVANLTPEQVYDLWCIYSDHCSASDQSAILGEFIQWYADKLGGNRPALEQAIS